MKIWDSDKAWAIAEIVTIIFVSALCSVTVGIFIFSDLQSAISTGLSVAAFLEIYRTKLLLAIFAAAVGYFELESGKEILRNNFKILIQSDRVCSTIPRCLVILYVASLFLHCAFALITTTI